MELDCALMSRRSVRNYTEELVPYDQIKLIIESGMWAPTACNKQSYRFIYLDGNQQLIKLYEAGAATFIKNCKQAILVLYDNRIDNVEYVDHIQSASAVIQNMLLKAYEEGIGTCWVCNLPPKGKVRKIYSIPKYYDPIALITLGYPKKEPKAMPRKHLAEDIIHYNSFDGLKENSISPAVDAPKIWVKRFLRRIYLRIPKTALILKIADKFEKKFNN